MTPKKGMNEKAGDLQMTMVIKENGQRELPFERERLAHYIDNIASNVSNININRFKEKALNYVEGLEEIKAEDIIGYLIRESQALVSLEEPEWDEISKNIFLKSLYKKASKSRFYNEEHLYGDYVGLQESLGEKGIYSQNILDKYSKKELSEAEKIIESDKDRLFTYNGLSLLANRYLATDLNQNVYELPQERWLTIALYLMQNEDKNKRMGLVQESYWAQKNLYMTTATPTMTRAGKANGQLSSCFIDTVDDSLQGIYDSNTDIARVSKGGGGVGTYLGFVRSANSTIRGVPGSSSGVIPWIKQLNNTAVSVDQLGQRKGAIAVYLDIFHGDIEGFLDLKLNNGDQRLRAHDVFTGVCIPDLFMEAVKNNSDWYLFDPKEVYDKKGWYLQDFYDEQKGHGSFRDKYQELINDTEVSKKIVKARGIMKRIMVSQLETGTPFMFYRDTVNRYNPNKHEGMIYSSNLCTEILQNMSPTTVKEEQAFGDEIRVVKQAGDFVVCNLSSINLGKAVPASDNQSDPDMAEFNQNNNSNNGQNNGQDVDMELLERLVRIQVRMLDNVIDLNELPVPQATITNKKYRAIGLGTFGWHHLLALKGLSWDSPEAIEYCDKLYEKINYFAIKASHELAREKGAYSKFEGSDWHTGQYFTDRGYTSEQWQELAEKVQTDGVRNSYIMAVAPNASTAQIAGSTASIDPVYKPFYYEQKNDYLNPVIAPDVDHETLDYYGESAHKTDQFASIRQNAARQRHVDQSISFNFYIPSTIKARTLMKLHIQAWNQGLKTTYYVRSEDLDVEECEWCGS